MYDKKRSRLGVLINGETIIIVKHQRNLPEIKLYSRLKPKEYVEYGLAANDEGIPLLVRNTTINANGNIGSYSNAAIGGASANRRPLGLGPFESQTLETLPHRLLKLDELPKQASPGSSQSTPDSTPTTTTTEFPKRWRRSDRRLRRLNTELLEAVETKDVDEVKLLLNQGANPNATCRLDLVSACHFAALKGGNCLEVLVKRGAERHRLDRLGRTPLHLAVWAGNVKEVAILLDFPEEIQERVTDEHMSSGAEEDIKKISAQTKVIANVRCDLEEVKIVLPKEWKDNIDHDCKEISGSCPLFKPGWTPLHVASATARPHCIKLLLAAGANPNASDGLGCTPLDVAGMAHYYDMSIEKESFTEVITLLLERGATFKSMRVKGPNNIDTPLHTAAEIEAADGIKALLENGASISCLNAAGLTPLHVCVKNEAAESLQYLADFGANNQDPLAAAVDVKDRDGRTVLQAAVEATWVGGVCTALEAGADVTLTANDGESPIHSAAELGDLDVLNEILSAAKQKSSLDCQNLLGETPLFIAIQHENVDCVKAILNEGASIKITSQNEINVFHQAAEIGNVEILKALFNHDEKNSKEIINDLCSDKASGLSPLHFAVVKNNPQCVEYLLEMGADVRVRTTAFPARASTPLHLAAVKNYAHIASIILNFDKTTLHEVNVIGWFPLHTAAHHGSRETIATLLQAGADLSGYTDGPKKFKKTAVDMLIHNLPKATEYLEELLDSYVTSSCNDTQDEDCVVKLDYSILMPRGCEMEQMKVVQALLNTGDRYNQSRLLVHPLIESFLYFKWKALLPFFYTILAFYALFLGSLTIFAVSVFFYRDTKVVAPAWLDPQIWSYALHSTTILTLIQELIFMDIKSKRYFFQMETIIKLSSIILASILPATVFFESLQNAVWPRHVATIALLLSWIEMMFLLSRFPNWGYYVLMFGKVATNVVKILLTFAFLVIGFSLSFMVQFHSMIPFDGPFSALIKTMVMMTSEFDYEAIFDEEHTIKLSDSCTIARFVFLVFLVLASIVLMNLMVGVAVNDINDLEVLGNIRRLAKQVQFLGTLDILVYNKFFNNILPKKMSKSVKQKRNISKIIEIYPGRPRWRTTKMLTSKLRDAILNKATAQKKQIDKDIQIQALNNMILEIHTKLMNDERHKPPKELDHDEDRHLRFRRRQEDVAKHLSDLDDGMTEIKDQILVIKDEKKIRDELHAKINDVSKELQSIKQCLARLEKSLAR